MCLPLGWHNRVEYHRHPGARRGLFSRKEGCSCEINRLKTRATTNEQCFTPPPHLPNALAATRQFLRWTPRSLTRPSPSSSTFLTTFSRDSLVRWREEFVARSKKARSWGGSIPSSGCAPVACFGDVDGSEVREGVDNGTLCGQYIWVRSYIERMSGVVTARGAVVGCGCRR